MSSENGAVMPFPPPSHNRRDRAVGLTWPGSGWVGLGSFSGQRRRERAFLSAIVRPVNRGPWGVWREHSSGFSPSTLGCYYQQGVSDLPNYVGLESIIHIVMKTTNSPTLGQPNPTKKG